MLLHFQMQTVVSLIRDQNLKLAIAFGIGLHHAGLHERDRKLVEELFLHQKIQVQFNMYFNVSVCLNLYLIS